VSASLRLVFDTSAIVAVFDARPTPYEYWQLADNEDADVVVAFPVGSMLDAAELLRIRASAWDGPLWSPNVHVLPLTESVAKEIGDQAGSLGTRHALFESTHLGWPVLTAEPDRYPQGTSLLRFE
jgi:hypothetical protein